MKGNPDCDAGHCIVYLDHDNLNPFSVENVYLE